MDEPTRPTNSGKTNYRLTNEVVTLLKAYGTDRFDTLLAEFVKKFGKLREAYRRERESHLVPLRLPDGTTLQLSPGAHNELQAKVIEDLGPRFAPGASVLYVGDTARKHLVCDTDKLAELGISVTEHDKLPDIVLYDEEQDWLFLIEAVTSHGPVSPKRHSEIEDMMRNCASERIYITGFLSVGEFRRYAADIAWETEVWIADQPDHMIHFNGPKFLGPYASQADGD